MQVLLIGLAAVGGATLALRDLIRLPGGGRIEVGAPGGFLGLITGSAVVAFGAYSIIGGGFGAVVLGKSGARGPVNGGFSYQPPNTPTIDVVVVDTSTWRVNFSVFVGSGDDTQDSIAVTVLRAGAADTLFHAVSGVQASDTISDNADLSADTTYRVLGRQKATNGGWSVADTLAVLNAVAGAGQFDPFLPASWTDTIHYDGYDSLSSVTAATCGTDCAAGPNGVYTLTVDNTTLTHGGRLSGYLPSDRMVDTFTVDFDDENAAPGFWWETSHPANSGGGPNDWQLNFADAASAGTGSGTTNVDRFYLRWTFFFENSDSVPHHAEIYESHSSSNKITSIPAAGNELLFQQWDGVLGFIDLTNNSNPPWGQNTCDVFWPNTWHLYYPADTMPGGPRPSFKDTSCRHADSGMDTIPVGNVNFVPGRVQHIWLCVDASPADGSEIISWGVVEEDRQGIAGYWSSAPAGTSNGTGVDLAETFGGVYRNSTYGGGPGSQPNQSQFVGAQLVVTGTTGSCVNPSA